MKTTNKLLMTDTTLRINSSDIRKISSNKQHFPNDVFGFHRRTIQLKNVLKERWKNLDEDALVDADEEKKTRDLNPMERISNSSIVF